MNVAYLVGHNTVRRNVMGLENRAPSEEELNEMKSQISAGMDEGAYGISTGLKYLPGSFSKVEEASTINTSIKTCLVLTSISLITLSTTSKSFSLPLTIIDLVDFSSVI